MATIEFFYDFGSPAAYLAYTQMPHIAERTRAQVVYRPFLLGGVFKATGNRSPIEIPAKGAWILTDFARYAAQYGVPFGIPASFPLNSLNLMRGAIAAELEGRLIPYSDAVYGAIFGERRNMEDPVVIAEVLRGTGFDPAAIMAAIGKPEVKDRLRQNTEDAIARGAFGAPTIFVGKEMFFGQDRLDFVEQEARKAA